MTDNKPYAERYRPQFHFSARENWLNDPNGCVFDNGEYHLYFQHNPTGLKWGNMTWGHAVSKDLVHWRQLPNAIEPYDNGTIFSGSAVVDVDNSSGFGTEGVAPLVAAFTHARKPFGQAIAFSTDHGLTWSLHEAGRHVVPNQGFDEGERDPKVFWHSPSQRWIMVLWVRMGLVRFFTSRDLKHWAHASDFSGDGFYECPDLFELPVDGNQQNVKWVLMDAAFSYWVGSFDGIRFVPEAGPMKGDFGGNFYAAQTWNNTGGRVVQIAWLRDGKYPNMPFSQQMSFPCELSLRTTPEGVRLCRMPVEEINAIQIDPDLITDRVLSAGEELQSGQCGDLFDITVEIDAPPHAAFGIRLHEIDIACADGYIRCLGKEAPLTAHDRKVSLRILVDRTSIEVFAQGGELCMSTCFLPLEQDTTIRCYSEAGTIAVRKFMVHRLRSAW
jgi:sucrose-6-phosphate hydrolase SacC (GH32 family)